MRIISIGFRMLWMVVATCLLAFCLLGFFYQLPGGRMTFAIVAFFWIAAGIVGLVTEWKNPWFSRGLFSCMFCGFALWWATITPSLNRNWVPELSRTVSSSFDDKQENIVHISNIRDFDWITPDTAHESWKDDTYNIDDIVGLDVYLSYWMGPYIAHTLVGFTFSDGRHLVFSAEIRREKGEEFSAIGGFFKKFELIMIAATEEDIIKLRTDIRRESVYRYPITVSKERMRALFLNYLITSNKLAQNAYFYNTVTANCTTIVFNMARIIAPKIPLDWRILFSGQLPSYLYDHKVIDTRKPLTQLIEEARIPPQNSIPRRDYSRAIRPLENTHSN